MIRSREYFKANLPMENSVKETAREFELHYSMLNRRVKRCQLGSIESIVGIQNLRLPIRLAVEAVGKQDQTTRPSVENRQLCASRIEEKPCPVPLTTLGFVSRSR